MFSKNKKNNIKQYLNLLNMYKKRFFLFLFFLLIPNISYAYVDPGVFALIWQSIIAFIFAALAYFRLFYFKTSEFLKKISFHLKNKSFIFIIDYFLLLLVLLLPILLLLENNHIYYGIKDYLKAFLSLLIFFIIINFVVYFSLKFFSKDKTYLFFISILILIFSYFISSGEEYIIKNYLDHNTIIYLRITSFIIVPIIIYYFVNFVMKFNINKIRIFVSTFIIVISLISSIGLFQKIKIVESNNKLWKFKKPEISKTDLKDNVFFIFTDAYLSPEYYNILYDEKENNLFKTFKEKKFFFKNNTFASYSSSRFSIPSILNSNIFSSKMTMETYKYNYRNKNNFLDNSFLTKTLKNNNFNHQFFVCDFKYVFKKRYCKERYTYLSLIEDIPIVEGIYYYNSFYRLYKRISLYLYEKQFFRNIIDNLTKDNEEELLVFLDKQIKKTKNKKKNFYSIVFTIPHVPWTLNNDCTWKSIPLSQNVKNGYLITDENLRINGYIDNLSCANNYLIKLIEIIEKYNEESIIILISDNGPFIRPNKLLKKKI